MTTIKKQSLITEFSSIYNYHRRWNKEHAIHDYNNVYKKTIRDLQQFGLADIKGKKILDLGCGSRFPFSLSAAANGAIVTALDLNYTKPNSLPVFFVQLLKYNGVKTAFKSLSRRVLFDKHYFNNLNEAAGTSLNPFVKDITFLVGDPKSSSYPLKGNYFDVIASNAVLEHVGNVETYFKEVNRLLNKDGLFYGLIHNYYSISGGHCLEWSVPDKNPSDKVEPWDHLRKNSYPTHIYLNKLKPEEYKMAAERAGLEVLLFEDRDVNHDANGKEGIGFLTESVKTELSQYPEELLLTRAYCIICRKK